MAQTLYLIRHTTPDVAPGICYGQLDIGVAASFPAEAQRVLDWLPPVELVITSPLIRAHALADYLAQARRCELRSDSRLMEKNFGAWEGRAWDSIARAEFDAWAADILGYTPPGGESARQLVQRVHAVLRELCQLPQQSIAVSTHAGVMRAMLAELSEVPLAAVLRWELSYGAVIAVRCGLSQTTSHAA